MKPFHSLSGKKVLVTGISGFKGGWLASLLISIGAEVIGFSRGNLAKKSPFWFNTIRERVTVVFGDIRDLERVRQTVEDHRPEIIFHLAAQPLMRIAFDNPVETFRTNIVGTVNVLEAIRSSPSVKAAVVVTTDKVYSNPTCTKGCVETDQLGGNEPYGVSKACCELVVGAYRSSYFRDAGAAIATARAGNVIGGGDFSEPRLVPDIIRALSAGVQIPIRGNLDGIRPWQHVLESASGYLQLANRLLQPNGREYATSFNFAPAITDQGVTVRDVIRCIIDHWGSGHFDNRSMEVIRETRELRLNPSKAAHMLGWIPIYSWKNAVAETVRWYREYYDRTKSQVATEIDMFDVIEDQFNTYMTRARQLGIEWASR